MDDGVLRAHEPEQTSSGESGTGRLPLVILAGVLVVLAAASLVFFLRPRASRLERLVFAESSTSVPGSLPFVAQARGFWKERGLEVQVAGFSAGRLGFDAMLKGDAQISTLAETPVALAAFREKSFVIIAQTMTTSTETRIVARRRSNIASPSDLRGKRIGVFQGTQAEYFLDVFLAHNGLATEGVQVINLQPPDMISAIVRGDIDAMVAWQPHAARATAALGADAIEFRNESIYTSIFCIATTRQYIREHPSAVEKFLGGLVDAERFIGSHTAEARSIVAKKVGLPDSLLASFYGEYSFRVALTPALINQLQAEGDWAIRTQRVPAGSIRPDYLQFVDPKPLQAIDPSRATIPSN